MILKPGQIVEVALPDHGTRFIEITNANGTEEGPHGLEPVIDGYLVEPTTGGRYWNYFGHKREYQTAWAWHTSVLRVVKEPEDAD